MGTNFSLRDSGTKKLCLHIKTVQTITYILRHYVTVSDTQHQLLSFVLDFLSLSVSFHLYIHSVIQIELMSHMTAPNAHVHWMNQLHCIYIIFFYNHSFLVQMNSCACVFQIHPHEQKQQPRIPRLVVTYCPRVTGVGLKQIHTCGISYHCM